MIRELCDVSSIHHRSGGLGVVVKDKIQDDEGIAGGQQPLILACQ